MEIESSVKHFLSVLTIMSCSLCIAQSAPLVTKTFYFNVCNCTVDHNSIITEIFLSNAGRPRPPSDPSPSRPPPPKPGPSPTTHRPDTNLPSTHKPDKPAQSTHKPNKPVRSTQKTEKPVPTTLKPGQSKPTTKPTASRFTTTSPGVGSHNELVPPLVEMVLLVDRSSKQILHNMTEIMAMVDDFKTYFHPDSKFGMSAFSDFSGDRWPAASSRIDKHETVDKHHYDKDGCYTFIHGLTEDVQELRKKSNNIEFLSSGDLEAGAVAMMLVAADKKMSWSQKDAHPMLKKVVLLLTDSGPLKSGYGPTDGKGHAIKGDGTDTCPNIKVPTHQKVGEFLKQEGISIYGLLENDAQYPYPTFDVFRLWKKAVKDMNISWVASDLHKDSLADISESIKNYIGKVKKQLT